MTTKTILVYEIHDDEGEWPPPDTTGFFDWFLHKVDMLPEHYRDRAQFRIFHEDECAVIQMFYQREETTAEQRERIAEENFKKVSAQEQEYDNYVTLYKKYGIPK